MKTLPFEAEMISELTRTYPTPYYLYDEAGIRQTARELAAAFSWAKGFKNYFAVKALPNPHVLRILKEEGMGVDCSSMAELVLAEKAGFTGQEIMFSGNDTPMAEFVKADSLESIINLDDISHIKSLESVLKKLPEIVCFRFNPGPERTGNLIIGHPAEAKFGLTRAQMLEAIEECSKRGAKRFGIHTMPASNLLDANYIIETARMMFELAVQIKQKLKIEVEFINLGGGFGIPYEPTEKALDIKNIATSIQELYETMMTAEQLSPRILMECGRFVTGPHGYLISTVIHQKQTYRDYVGLDASMANLMRPAMYGAYHHITVLGKENSPLAHKYDVTGALCENNDKFAIERLLPKVEVGDVLVFHDAGAHAHTMGFNYNGMLRSAELLLRESGEVEQIRRAETLDDYFSTLVF